MKSFLSELGSASAVIDGESYSLNDYPTTLIDDLCGRHGEDLAAIVAGVEELGFAPDSALEMLDPAIGDWPEAYVESLRENQLSEASDEDVLEALCQDHEDMRFGNSIDLNRQFGFYFNPGDGRISLDRGTDSGHLIEVLSGLDTIDISRNGDMQWCAHPDADEYVTQADDKMSWVFDKAKGPWFLVADHHARRGDDFYFLVVRFLSAEDDAAFMSAFSGASA